MLIVIGLMGCGILLGYLLRKQHLKFIHQWITVAIYALLFLLGISVGSNPRIMDNMATIGLEALIITLGAVAGSVLCAWMVYRFCFNKS